MMMDLKKYGLSVNTLATKIMPSLTPALANPTLNLDEVCNTWTRIPIFSPPCCPNNPPIHRSLNSVTNCVCF